MAATGEKTLGHSELKPSLIGDFHTGTLIGYGGSWRVLRNLVPGVFSFCNGDEVVWRYFAIQLFPPPSSV